MQTPAPKSFIVTIVPQTQAEQTTLADVVTGALGITGVLVLLAVTLGAVLAAVRVGWQRRHPPQEDHLPPVSPLITPAGGQPSSQGR